MEFSRNPTERFKTLPAVCMAIKLSQLKMSLELSVHPAEEIEGKVRGGAAAKLRTARYSPRRRRLPPPAFTSSDAFFFLAAVAAHSGSRAGDQTHATAVTMLDPRRTVPLGSSQILFFNCSLVLLRFTYSTGL